MFGVLKIKDPAMYKINIYTNPVMHPVSHPFSLLFFPLIIPAVNILNNVIIILDGVITEYGIFVYVITKDKSKKRIIEIT